MKKKSQVAAAMGKKVFTTLGKIWEMLQISKMQGDF